MPSSFEPRQPRWFIALSDGRLDVTAPKPKWQLALDMLDELAGWGQRPPVVCADAVLMIGTATTATSATACTVGGWRTSPRSRTTSPPTPSMRYPKKPYAGVGSYPLPRYRGSPTPLHQHIAAAAADPAGWQQVTWREGSRGPMSGYFTAIRIRPAGRKHTHRLNPDGSLDPAWLLVQWPKLDPSSTVRDHEHEDQHLPAEPV